MKVLYVTSEAVPFASSGGLGDVAGSLPAALRKRLIGCRVVLPMYEDIPKHLRDGMKFITSLSVPVSWRRQYCGIFEAKHNGVIYYFLDNQYYFKRANLYGHYDDAERFAFFARAVLEMLPHLDGFKPDIIEANDWQSALVPVYYSLYYANREDYSGIKTVFTIHNIQYQGKYGTELLDDVFGLPKEALSIMECDKCINLMKGAIETANAVTTVSPTYAGEILDPWYAHGLDAILRARSWKLTGILNGIDTDSYNPETDKDIEVNYNAGTLKDKHKNKLALQRELGLPERKDVPLYGMVTRLVAHKGIDLVKAVLEEMLQADLQVAVLGSGDWEYESFFTDMAEKYPGKLAVKLGFIKDLSRRIYAGSDFFLMPSKSEPCGLAQMIALRYGTVPIVRETGGLKDSVTDSGDGEGNGFTFKSYYAHDLLNAIWRAFEAYGNKKGMTILAERAMACDNSWGTSANRYIKLFKALLKQKD